MLGSTVSHYQVIERIGAGGMGVVYKGWDERLRREVALKVLPTDSQQSAESRRRFLQEARSASALNHPGIVTIYDIVKDGEAEVLVMELVDGRPLAELIPAAGLPLAEVVGYGRQLADALAAAHAAGIVHRDLKPSNVMVGTRGRVKILDFGLAKFELRGGPDEVTVSAPMTRAGTLLGTLEYMSPEQVNGDPVGPHSDIFSLGGVLYEMLTGRRPFGGRGAPELLHRIVYESFVPVATLRPDAPAALAELVERALEKAVSDRPQTMAEVEHRLAAIASGAEATTLASAATAPARGSVAPQRRSSDRAPGARLGGGRRRLFAVALGSVAALAVAGVWTLATGSWPMRGTGGPVADALPETAPDLYRHAKGLLDRYDRPGHVDRAIESLQRGLVLDPGSAPAHAALAVAFRRRYREKRDPIWLDQAENSARRALDLDPQLVAGHVVLGFVEVERKRLDEADALFTRALVLEPNNTDARAGLAEVQLGRGDGDAADLSYRQALELRPDDWQLHLMRGVGRLRSGDYPAAAAVLERAAELVPDSGLVLRNLGGAYHLLGRYAEASTAYQKSLEVAPDPVLYSNLGTLYFYRGLYQEATTAFEKAVDLGANDHPIWANLGDSYRWGRGQQQRATEAYTRALQMLNEEIKAQPGDGDLASRRAVLLAKRGDGEAARREVATLAPARLDPASLFRLSQASEIAGDRAAALTLLDRALAAGYSPDEVQHDPELTKLRADVRYHQMLARRGLGEQAPAAKAPAR